MSNPVLIINTGGTYNKKYNEIKGELEVVQNNLYIEEILYSIYKKQNPDIIIKNIINKDSLDIVEEDRIELLELIQSTEYKNIIIIHGTDTMDKTARYIDIGMNKNIVFVGSMIPFSINPIEASFNLGMSLGYLNNMTENNICISMNGEIGNYKNIKKNKQLGYFEFNNLN